MALGFATGLRNARADAITTFAGGSAKFRIYSGTRPATGAALSGNTLLAELTANSTFAAAASNGVLTLNAIADDTAADATGTAAWFRLVKSDNTFVLDGNVAASGSDLNLNTTSIVANATVSITSFVITEGNG